MRLRTRLVLALLLLSALPLAVIILLNYVSAQRAVRKTVQAEADQLTRDMEAHLAGVRADIRLGMEQLGSPLFLHYLQSDETPWMADGGLGASAPPESSGGPKAPPLPELGQVADLLQTIEVERNWEDELDRHLDAELDRLDETADLAEELGDETRAWVLQAPLIRKLALGGSRLGLEVARPFMSEAVQMDEETMDAMASDLGQLFDEAVRSATTESDDPQAQAEIEERLQAIGKRFAARFGVSVDAESDAEDARADSDSGAADSDAGEARRGAEANARRAEAIARRDRRRAEARTQRAEMTPARPPLPPAGLADSSSSPSDFPQPPRPRLLLDLDTTVRQGDRVLGRLRPVLDPNAVLQRVMGPIDLRRGEVPFLVDRDGQLFVLEETHRSVLEELDVASMVPPEDEAAEGDVSPDRGVGASAFEVGRKVSDDWVVVLSNRQPSGLLFGIASPVGESLAAVRSAAARNLAGGVGLLALAMLGILPLARRMTGDLEHLTEGVERIAAGELETEVEVRSKDEIAQLAGAFNRMASDLKVNQGKLVDQALKERSLAAELDRKNEELEAARTFQLSMLPSTLPEHPQYEVAVAMRTATEVGGDYYDFHLGHDFQLGDGQASAPLTVAVGDATGHGVTAGRMVTVVKSLFSAASEPDPASFLADANRTVRRMNLGRMAMALVLARFEGECVTLASAGMPPALVLRGEGQVEEVTLGGMPLGGIDRRYRDRTVALSVGDVVLFQSDGLPEQPDTQGDPLGYGAIREHLAIQADRSPQTIIDGLLELLDLWIEGGPPADDVTFVAIRRRS